MARQYSPYPTIRTEPDMREEFNNFLDGEFPGIPKKQTAVLRKMRRPLEACPCVDSITKEPDRDSWCPYCGGEGYFWDETFIDVYKVIIRSDVGNALKENSQSPGFIDIPLSIFYVRYNALITKEDRIVELELSTDGQPITPYVRRAIYRIGTPIDLRADNGKLEYWKLDCYLDERKFLNGADG